MTHFGLICPAASGHLNPMTALGHELKQRGHWVTLMSVLDVQPRALAAGLEFQPIGEAAFPVGAMAKAHAKLGQLSGMAASLYTIKIFEQAAAMFLQEGPAVIKSAGMDALLIDQTSFGASTVADFLGIPFISICCALMMNHEPAVPPVYQSWRYQPGGWARLRNQAGHQLMAAGTSPVTRLIASYRRRWHLPPFKNQNDAYSQLAQLGQQPAEFEFPRQSLPDCFHFTGPYASPFSREPISFPFERLTGQPIIYASLGTVQNRLFETFQTIAAACQGLDAQLVMTLGGGNVPEALPALPGSPLVVAYAPQLELLQRATLAITHAGMNTTLECLSNGVPLVAIPIANDQPGVAARIAWTGAGEVVPLQRLTVSRLRVAIRQVLTQNTYKQNALRLQAAIQTAGGVQKAANIIEQVVATGKSVYNTQRC